MIVYLPFLMAFKSHAKSNCMPVQLRTIATTTDVYRMAEGKNQKILCHSFSNRVKLLSLHLSVRFCCHCRSLPYLSLPSSICVFDSFLVFFVLSQSRFSQTFCIHRSFFSQWHLSRSLFSHRFIYETIFFRSIFPA